MAERQGKHLARFFNKHYAETALESEQNVGTPFQYKHLGMLAYVGSYRYVVSTYRPTRSVPYYASVHAHHAYSHTLRTVLNVHIRMCSFPDFLLH